MDLNLSKRFARNYGQGQKKRDPNWQQRNPHFKPKEFVFWSLEPKLVCFVKSTLACHVSIFGVNHTSHPLSSSHTHSSHLTLANGKMEKKHIFKKGMVKYLKKCWLEINLFTREVHSPCTSPSRRHPREAFEKWVSAWWHNQIFATLEAHSSRA